MILLLCSIHVVDHNYLRSGYLYYHIILPKSCCILSYEIILHFTKGASRNCQLDPENQRLIISRTVFTVGTKKKRCTKHVCTLLLTRPTRGSTKYDQNRTCIPSILYAKPCTPCRPYTRIRPRGPQRRDREPGARRRPSLPDGPTRQWQNPTAGRKCAWTDRSVGV